jgi:hypothetical protein
MLILRIEHLVSDFDTWKRAAFDADPIGRGKMGVRRHQVARSISDPSRVMIDLEFDSLEHAERMHAALRELWQSPLARIGDPETQIMESVEVMEY